MAKKKFYFNSETLDYEEIQINLAYRLKQVLFHAMSGIFLGLLFFFLFVSIIKSPREKEISLQKSRMEGQYKALQGQMSDIQGILTDLQQRDDNLYRVVFQAEPIPYEVRRTANTNADYYEQLLRMTNSQIVVETTKKLNELKKQLYVQSKSYDEIVVLAQNKEKMLEAIPAIQPVANKDLTRVASGYGMRMDPIYHSRRFHAGMDFTAPTGTDIYATGNGRVLSAGWQQGYGNCVEIDHGFGYVTLYGHMHSISVNAGQTVNRGEVIGLVGNTGKSTGPHLHYEVHYKGEIMNPQNYYFLDLTPEEYDKMVQLSNNAG
ncbi:MAG TPA: M23 family metallopeptidase, partial [Paludibacteraceae bacterium]|nr:M23 family metallopeptidase [Paludibacteraceae bacterium]